MLRVLDLTVGARTISGSAGYIDADAYQCDPTVQAILRGTVLHAGCPLSMTIANPAMCDLDVSIYLVAQMVPHAY
jgi:hypothetical protein